MKDRQFDYVLDAEKRLTIDKCARLIEMEIGRFVLERRSYDTSHLNALKIRLVKMIKEIE